MPLPLIERPGRHAARISRPRTAPERRRVESVLAVARLILACAALSAVAIVPSVAGANAAAVRILVSIYAAQSVATAFLVHYQIAPAVSPLIFHLLDIAWAVVLTAATGGPNSPLFVFFVFCQLGAAYRWALRETIWTGVAVFVLFAIEATQPLQAMFGFPTPRFDGQVVLMRGTYFLIATIVLGYFAEEEQLHNAETTIVGGVLAHIRAETGFRAALRHVAHEILEVFEAKRLIVTAVESDSGRAVWWEATLHQGEVALALEPGELDEARRTALRFSLPGDAVRIVRTRKGCSLLALDRDGGLIDTKLCEIPPTLWTSPDVQAAVLVNVSFADHWTGRVLLMFDRPPGLADVRLMHRLICHATPVMYSHYLLRRLRTRVAATERLRVARELHDGVIQSLAGLELHVAALRRTREAPIRAAGIDEDLANLQQLLGEEARSVRDLMHRMRPMDIPRGQAVRVFADLVARFRRESGIDAKFTADVEGVELPPATARELGRTLQEALRNVRKHSGARHVDVAFTTDNGQWKLIVANDGRPFDFTGRWTLKDLETEFRGPRVIKERVREMGGDLAIESTPRRGVKLEVTVPRRRRLHV
jgi:signal transduction histidine kinase